MTFEPGGVRIAVLVTGPDVDQSGGAGVQQHVRYLIQVFTGDESITVIPFASTSTRYDEPFLQKAVRLVYRWFIFVSKVRHFDVVHINSSIDARSIVRDFGFLFIAWLARRPVILQFHGGGAHRVRWANHRFVRSCVARMLRLPRVILFLSTEQLEPMAKIFGLQTARLTRNFVPLPSRRTPPHLPHPLRVVFLGRLEKSKGVLETIDAFNEVASDGWVLRIAGSGAAEELVQQASAASPCVDFLGFVEGPDRDALLDWADVLVLPTDHDEGLPYSVLEAAAYGCALVTSARGALGEVVRDGTNGYLVPPRDSKAVAAALRKLDADTALIGRFGAASRHLVEQTYSFECMHEQFGLLYREVLGL